MIGRGWGGLPPEQPREARDQPPKTLALQSPSALDARFHTKRAVAWTGDTVHLTATGYRLVAGWLYEALMRGWRDRRARAPESRLDR